MQRLLLFVVLLVFVQNSFSQNRFSNLPSNSSRPLVRSGTGESVRTGTGSDVYSAQLKEIEKKVKGCIWVDSIYDTKPAHPSVMYSTSYVTPNQVQNSTTCVGTLKCSYSLSDGSTSSVFFENVVCRSEDVRCPTPEKCLIGGGFLRSDSITETSPEVMTPNRTEAIK